MVWLKVSGMYNTRHKNDLRPMKSSTCKGLLRSNCNFIADWNLLDAGAALKGGGGGGGSCIVGKILNTNRQIVFVASKT